MALLLLQLLQNIEFTIEKDLRIKQEAIKGQGKLLEPEEMDRLEKAGYQAGPAGTEGVDEEEHKRLLEEEERRFNQELRTVQIEDVEDEDA